MRGRVAILTGAHLCHNPRVIKEATALANAGCEVAVLGAWFDAALRERDRAMLRSAPFRFVPSVDAVSSRTEHMLARARMKLGLLCHRHAHIQNRWHLGYAYPSLRRAALAHGAELYIAHSEQAMAVAVDLRRAGRAVAVDLEDWFSEDLPPAVRADRPVRLVRADRPVRLVQALEQELLTKGAYASCPSQAMSAALAQHYGCPAPVAIYNAFAWSERTSIDAAHRDRRNRSLPSIHWFSQTLGEGRGLEDLIAALPLLHHKAEVHLRGAPAAGFEASMLTRVPEQWRQSIFLHSHVANDELLSRVAEHDIGFAGEMKYCRSRDLTVTNKLLCYLLAGLAVVASDTAGQREVAARAEDAVSLYRSGDAAGLAVILNSLLGSRARLACAKQAALAAAENTFCWERQEPVLLKAVEGALTGARPPAGAPVWPRSRR
jgi:glycosyltransferase involved in cell wall biosynthesis